MARLIGEVPCKLPYGASRGFALSASGESNLLNLINDIPINDIESALDNFPVRYVVITSADGVSPTIATKNAGSPIRLDPAGTIGNADFDLVGD